MAREFRWRREDTASLSADAGEFPTAAGERIRNGYGSCSVPLAPSLHHSKTHKMNALRNKVQLIGRLGKDPELVQFEEGKTKASFPLATNEVYKNASGDRMERTQWHDVVVWGKLSEVVGAYLTKGSEVAVEGRLSYRTYEDSEGHTRYVTEVVANELLLLEKRPEGKEAES
jgi:single-strand DNA-binding protein